MSLALFYLQPSFHEYFMEVMFVQQKNKKLEVQTHDLLHLSSTLELRTI